MPKLASINFDSRILDAARDGRLVVFAGAGVSMGPPSNLPDFWRLAEYIAQGTQRAVEEPLDRFLGQLEHQGVAVKRRAVERLDVSGSKPKELHQDLLKLFGTVERVRIVTTNFDLLFEQASVAVFGQVPDVFHAPALPLGDDFKGIVHVHGALTHPGGLVLTDSDFGRAYLTQGWARRFLVDVFRHFTVLFVGYSHGDVVMNYLARALPAGGAAGRFALTDAPENWGVLGITPITFVKAEDGNRYRGMELALHHLAALTSRGALDWQARLADLCSGQPPIDDEAEDEIEHALREVHTTRFFVRAAREPSWAEWLHRRGHLGALFEAGPLAERDKILMTWLTDSFMVERADHMFHLIALNQGRLNPALWDTIACQLTWHHPMMLPGPTLERWVTLLLAAAPQDADRSHLIVLAEKCACGGQAVVASRIFAYLCRHQLQFKSNGEESVGEGGALRRFDAEVTFGVDVYAFADLWVALRPHLDKFAPATLAAVTNSLEEIYRDLAIWDMVDRDWDASSYHRVAIEPHEQDRFPEPIDVLIDAARDALEHLATTRPSLLDGWIASVNMSVPLLRRLAVHAVAMNERISADDCLRWILDGVGLRGTMEHHEVYRAVALSYATASEHARQAVVDAVLAISESGAVDWSAEIMTDWVHFAWLSWLTANSDCANARSALAPIAARHPEWQPSDHPDLTHWSGTTSVIASTSPWTVEELLSAIAEERLDQMLTFREAHLVGPGRNGVLRTVTKACTQQPQWALGLIDALAARARYVTDLWRAALHGLQDAELTVEQWRHVLNTLDQPELLAEHGAQIARLLYALVRDGGTPISTEVLDDANVLASSLWGAAVAGADQPPRSGWFSAAINHPAGVVMEFWLASVALLMQGKSGEARQLPAAYKRWFEHVVGVQGVAGGFGRAVLTNQAAFLSGVDDNWTREYIVPLFSEEDLCKFAPAWDGFLAGGRLTETLATTMLPAFRHAVSRLDASVAHHGNFIRVYTTVAVFFVDDATQEMLPELLQRGSVADRHAFATTVGRILGDMDEGARRELWRRWLKRYWRMRLDSAPVPLDDAEIVSMLDWTAYLSDDFPDAVLFAIQAPKVTMQHTGLLQALSRSDLAQRFPQSMAALLIYLCGCVRGYQMSELATFAQKLPPIPTDLHNDLNESLARAGGVLIADPK